MVLAGSNWIGWVDFCCIIVAPLYGQIGISNGNQNEARFLLENEDLKVKLVLTFSLGTSYLTVYTIRSFAMDHYRLNITRLVLLCLSYFSVYTIELSLIVSILLKLYVYLHLLHSLCM